MYITKSEQMLIYNITVSNKTPDRCATIGKLFLIKVVKLKRKL